MSGNVLVVEDNDEIRDALKDSLNFMGCSVTLATNGLEALHMLEHEPRPSLILLDLIMPIMDGWEFRNRQKQNPALCEIPTVVITADGNSVLNAKLMGVQRGLQKPIDLDELMAVVCEFCH